MISVIKSWQVHVWVSRLICLGLLASWFIITGVSTVEAKTLVFEDDFSQGLTKWQHVRSNPEYWTINSNGQVQADVPYPSTVVELVPQDLYWDKNWQNIEFSFDYFPLAGGDKNFGFGYQDSQNWYEMHFVAQSYELVKIVDGQQVWSVWHGGGFANGSKYKIKIILDRGQISLFINDVLSSQDIDPHFDHDFGKITIKAGTGAVSPTRVAFDNVQVYVLNDLPPPPYVFKQSDPTWAQNEYDSASVWASDDFSIKRWGCALTSLAMILRYHQINTLPDNQVLNPDTLNTWLLNQPDGYFKEGHLNWQAGVRLAKIMNQKNQTTKLEYSYLAGDQVQAVNNHISQNRPVVVAIPGHFLLADGIKADQTDWYIRDPAYSYSLFSQHQVAASSFRAFQPSQTDLSYIIITHPPELNITIDQPDLNASQVQTYSQFLSADDLTSSAKNNNLTITQIAKPITGTYQLNLTQPQLGSAQLNFYLYDKEGNIQVIDKKLMVGLNPVQLQLNFDADQVVKSQLRPQTMTWQTWSQLLGPMYDKREIKRQFVVSILEKTAMTAHQNPPDTTTAFVQHIKNLLRWLSPAISQSGSDYLIQELDHISVI